MSIHNLPPWQKSAAVYNLAADHFDDPPLGFWSRHGERAVELLELNTGERVLDVGCGTGASAIPAAQAVGAGGYVFGIDVAENMVLRARAKARQLRLFNIDFEVADMSQVAQFDATIDAIVSAFSIFFVADMKNQIARMWRILPPGGRLCITVWGHGAFAPGAEILFDEIKLVRPDIPEPKRPWTQLSNPNELQALMVEAGTSAPNICCEADNQVLKQPDDWWTIALGSGYRAEIEQLLPDEQCFVRRRVIERLEREGVTSIRTPAIHAVAWKSA